MTRYEFLFKHGYFQNEENKDQYTYYDGKFIGTINFTKKDDPIDVKYYYKTRFNLAKINKLKEFYCEVERIYKKALILEDKK